MSAPREFDAETRVRAVRLYGDRLRYHGDSKLAARKQVGALLDINPATLHDWIEHEQRSSKPASAGDDASIEGVDGCRRRTPSCVGRTRS